MEYDVLAFIGRFQPFHDGHKSVVDVALTKAKKVAIVLGSHLQPRTARNPFTTQERIDMISSVYPDEVASGRIKFVPQVDHTYNLPRWIAGVSTGVSTVAHTPFTPDPVNIGLIGHSKDHSSFYLKSFPTWGNIEADNLEDIHATDIRNEFFNDVAVVDYLPAPVANFLHEFQHTDSFESVKAEHDFILDFKKQWASSPYPPVFYTADAVVVQSGYILLVKRGAMPGEGQWALPGGYVNQFEESRDAALRELKEETKIKVPLAVLNGSIRSWRLFENPYRSQRGRVLSVSYHVELRASEELPELKGSDDAAKAKWIPIGNLRREAMFEDHYDIIESLVNI